MKLLKPIDRFAVTFNPHVKNEGKFSSIISILLSVAVVAIAFLYFVYVLYQWYQGEIFPKTISQIQKTLNSTLNITKNSILLEIWNPEDGMNPLNFSNLYIVPFVITSNLKNKTDVRIISQEEIIIVQEDERYFVQLRNVSLTQIEGVETPVELQIVLAKCDASLNLPNITCADPSLIDKYQYDSELYMLLKTTSWNNKEKIFEDHYNENLFIFDDTTPTFNQILIMKGEFYVDQQQVVPEAQQTDLISSYEIFSQTLQQNKAAKKLHTLTHAYPVGTLIVYFSNTFIISRLKEISRINYPTLGEVIAQVNGIYQILMSISILVTIFNSWKMGGYLRQKIREFYYPEMAEIEVNKSLFGFGDISSVKNTKNGVYYDVKSVENQIEIQDRIIEKKQNYLNIIYEISRLQFAVQTLMNNKQALKDTRKQGIKMNLKEITPAGDKEYQNISNDKSSRAEFNLEDQDAEILCFIDDDEKDYIQSTQPTKIHIEP